MKAAAMIVNDMIAFLYNGDYYTWNIRTPGMLVHFYKIEDEGGYMVREIPDIQQLSPFQQRTIAAVIKDPGIMFDPLFNWNEVPS